MLKMMLSISGNHIFIYNNPQLPEALREKNNRSDFKGEHEAGSARVHHDVRLAAPGRLPGDGALRADGGDQVEAVRGAQRDPARVPEGGTDSLHWEDGHGQDDVSLGVLRRPADPSQFHLISIIHTKRITSPFAGMNIHYS